VAGAAARRNGGGDSPWKSASSRRHAADLGISPVVIEDACGAGHADAAQRSCEALHFAGDAIMTDTEAFCAALGKRGG
jgi:nicotinamidase-related amidase